MSFAKEERGRPIVLARGGLDISSLIERMPEKARKIFDFPRSAPRMNSSPPHNRGLNKPKHNKAEQTRIYKKETNMDKIKMTTPLVEMDGDEMTRILWKMIKDELLLPFIDLKTEYYDLGLEQVR